MGSVIRDVGRLFEHSQFLLLGVPVGVVAPYAGQRAIDCSELAAPATF